MDNIKCLPSLEGYYEELRANKKHSLHRRICSFSPLYFSCRHTLATELMLIESTGKSVNDFVSWIPLVKKHEQQPT